MEDVHSTLQKKQKQQAKKEQELQELRSELVELERAWRSCVRQMEEEEAQRGAGVQLDEAQVKQKATIVGTFSGARI